MYYGKKPKVIGYQNIHCSEMMFYQYLPIKLSGDKNIVFEKRLECFSDLILKICKDFILNFGIDLFEKKYIYLTAKYMYQLKKCSYNREGWHSDGFMTDDINYIWSDKNPTIFNISSFKLTAHDTISMMEMNQQADPLKDFVFPEKTILMLNEFNIHKVSDVAEEGMRTFVKVSFSEDKYDLIGNSHNYDLDYNWDMKNRKISRNIPQTKL